MQLRLNVHSIVGFFATLVMVLIAYLQNWKIAWAYFLLAIVMYSVAVTALSVALEIIEEHEADDLRRGIVDKDTRRNAVMSTYYLRLLLGAHFAFIFLVMGMVILPGPDQTWTYAGYFIASIALGVAAPFLILTTRSKKKKPV